jgi:HTH-type transcriptional regulator / antitoxin HigA
VVPEAPTLFNLGPRHPGKILRSILGEKGWTQDDLSKITGIRRQTFSSIISGKSGISPEMALRLSAAFGNPASEWLRWDSEYQLANIAADTDIQDVASMKALYEIAPVRDMERRGWIRPTETVNDLRSELAAFYEADPIDEGISLSVAPRRTASTTSPSPAETAWCFRARQLARTLLVDPFSAERLPKTKSRLRRLAAHPKEARHIGPVLAEYGIRFVVVEPLPGARVDGAALWDEIGPIVAVSIRHDRIDGFWFTLMHELEHIQNQDPISIDSGLVDGTRGVTISVVNDSAEDRANRGAASSLITTKEIDSFIHRVGPLYSKDRIVQFANRIKIHPGIIVGQLQYRGELGYMALRDFLVKIREDVISTALTDGWGHSISPAHP